MNLEYFPYEPREGQRELIRFVQRALKRGNACVNAPTGFGKTPCILAALLAYAERHGLKIIWAVRTGNETDRAIEELKVINEALGESIPGLSFRGKRDMCLLARELKGELGYEEVAYLCKAKAKECRYKANLSWEFVDSLAGEALLYSEILKLCAEEEVCPYEAQRALLPVAQVVALSYNYIIHPGMRFSLRSFAPFARTLLVVDEAHNLQRAASALNSVRITLGTLTRARAEAERFGTARAKEVARFIALLHQRLLTLLEELKQAEQEDAELDVHELIHSLSEGFDYHACAASIKSYGTRIRRERLKQGRAPRSSLHRLGIFLEALLDAAATEGVAAIATRVGNSLEVEVWDMRSEEVLRDVWSSFAACVFCSGTLSPIKAFAETIGLRNYSGRSFPGRFSKQNIKTLITMDLSTEGERLGRDMRERYLRAIEGFVSANSANLAVFTASYRIQRSLLPGLREIAERHGRELFVERRGMSGDSARELLDGFKACSSRHKKGLLMAPAQGRFAEGADFPGDELEGIFLVGVPFDRMNTRTKLYLEYYKKLYGEEKGNLYAYVIPALKRASQALGRCLRSENDRAIFVLGDRRYGSKGFLKMLPDYIRVTAKKGTGEEVAMLRLPER